MVQNGFHIMGQDRYDREGWSVSGGGDFNGDGLSDVVVGSPNDNIEGRADNGKAHIVFGKRTRNSATFHLRDLSSTNGFGAFGQANLDEAGRAVALGDINGDGTDDLIVGAHNVDPGGRSNAGRTYVVYGNLLTEFELSVPEAGNYIYRDELVFSLTNRWFVSALGPRDDGPVRTLPYIRLNIGDEERRAILTRETEENGILTLHFVYRIQAEDHDADGIEMEDVITLNGGSIRYTGTEINVPLQFEPVATSAIRINAEPPRLLSIWPPLARNRRGYRR